MIWPFLNLNADDMMVETLSTDYAHAMADIHAKSFRPAWTDGDFIGMLNNAATGGVLLRLPYDRGGDVVGFAMVRLAADEAEILTIAVDPKWQGKGVGRRLMDTILANLRVDGIATLFLEVDETNKNAIALYRRIGFEQVATRKNYYSGQSAEKSHALVMRRDVG